MSNLNELLFQEILKLNKQMNIISKELKTSPKGTLSMRKTKKGNVFYRKYKHRDSYKEECINNDASAIATLIEKAKFKKLLKSISYNIQLLTNCANKMLPMDSLEILETLPEKYQSARNRYNLLASKESNCLNFDRHCSRDEDHVHQTNCGIWVASKNEVFICNSLDERGIKFEYEPTITLFGRTYRPDFVIHFPDGKKWFWEHFGLVSKLEYCKANAYKINDYYNYGYIPGKNLIVTISNPDGSIDLHQVDDIINNKILPEYL